MLGAFGANVCFAAWEVVPELRLLANADDNPRLGTELQSPDLLEEEDTATSMQFDGRLSLANFTERSELFVEPRYRTDSYRDAEDKELESDDLFLVSRALRRWRSTTAGLRSYVSRESILSSELLEAAPLDPDVEDPVPVETGVLERPDEHRTRVLIAPYLETRLSERTSLLLDARYQDVSYSGPPISGRSDFDESMFSAGIARSANERNRVEAQVTVSQFDAEQTRNETDTVGVEGTFRRTLSDTWTFALSTGVLRSEFRFLLDPTLGTFDEGVDTTATLGLGFRKRTEIATLNLDARRLVTPNASGHLEERDEFRIFLDRQLTPRVSGSFAVRYIDTSALGNVSSFQRDYYRLGFDFEWAMTPQWSLGGGFDWTRQEWDDRDEEGTSNALWFGMTYRGLSRRNPRNN
ncbi:MAG TPA: hypothetical protein VF322_08355 [Gammaproteobacteria bacterium]